MLKDYEALKEYIKENYQEVTDNRLNDDHWDIYCTKCKIVRGFQVVKRSYTTSGTQYAVGADRDLHAPHTIYFLCPVCKTYKLWITFNVTEDEEGEDGQLYGVTRRYRVTSIPGEGLEDITELPEDPPTLRKAYRQAIRAMDANAHSAAAAMFRRALQVITRDILGAQPGNLANELQSLIGTKYNSVTLTNDFSEIGYIIKEAGNQGAHPDEDPDLLDFTQQDAEDLQKIFMELVSDLFIVPEAIQKAKTDFMQRRKIEPSK